MFGFTAQSLAAGGITSASSSSIAKVGGPPACRSASARRATAGHQPWAAASARARASSARPPPLAYAAYNGHTEIVEYLLKRGAEIDAKTENGSTALFFASRFGHIETVRTLLKHQADPTIVNDNDETAVDWALKGKNTDIEDILRAAGGRSGKSVTIDLSK